MLENFLIIIAFNWIIVTILWLISLKTLRADFIDVYWGPSFFFSAMILLLIQKNFYISNFILLFLIGLWSFRLGIYLYLRNRKKSEDIRYVKIRQRRGDLGLYATAYLTQVALIGIVSIPIQFQLGLNEKIDLNYISWIGMTATFFGILIETIADIQLSNFKSSSSNNKKLMDKGLWYYSRHPNYFGDSLFWWGIFVLSYSITFNFFMVLSPIIMTYFLLRVSGVSLLERQIKYKKDGYNEYIESTSSFILMPKKMK